jgi:hypothetical protein
MKEKKSNNKAVTHFCKNWLIFFAIWVVYSILVYGSNNDWKSATALFLKYIPLYIPIFWGAYFFFGTGVALLSNVFIPFRKWLPWLIILVYALVPRCRSIIFSFKHWELSIFLFDGIATFFYIFWSVIGYRLFRNKKPSGVAVFYGILVIIISISFTEVSGVVNFISTHGAYIQYKNYWESWEKGENLPQDWETAEVEGIRYILRDHFIGHNKCHGYYFDPNKGAPPKFSAWGTMRSKRKLPNGWFEFLSSD